MQTGSWGGSGDSGAEDQVFSLCAPLLKRGPHKGGGGALLVSVPRDEPRVWHGPRSLQVRGLEGLDQWANYFC